MVIPQFSAWFQSAAFLVCSRFLAAILGGYIFSAISVSLLAVLVPLSKTDSVLLAVSLSVLVYTCVFIWVFSVRSLVKIYGWLIALSASQIFLLAVIKGWL
ncbi:hypothetical protein J8L98_01850 [Pseudoalteromonas sp. MMG013]|uniref:DUF3649 domain-containing protein n=1 Tax=Pseudoalteromonas aurantia 208 TaxID=1314867 RepID=A0ABR9EHM3_9GAMM|nr:MULTISPECIES: hypothetical protein [Pseudoalteromonas]MBE0370232.1 hypothetical protein [Pseudoalteromonas aurantia 208]MBQ4846757.1 hypothetical protein [Pseudoalteromonas sp. MMG005]MBQ4850365.1 hypothetical protein [Pseudoalteromonas sp. MMG012]MBQ4860434.1 hypothetical protein [Pseudoalteromonas sp. MMG013]